MAHELTPDQSRAVEAITGDLAISAGAGSGKTTVLARRFAQGLRPEGGAEWSPAGIDQIVTITFTAKAAGEIAERVRRVVNEEISPEIGRTMDEAWISTIHTLCGRLVRRHALECGVEPDFSQADEVQSVLLQAEAFETAAARLCSVGDFVGAMPDADVISVFDAYPFETVRDGVVSLHDNIRAMGLSPSDVEVPSGREMLAEVRARSVRCATELVDLSAECDPKSAAARNGVCAQVYAEALLSCALDDDQKECERLEGIVASFAMRKAGDDRIKEAIGCLRDANEEIARVLLGMRQEGLLRGLEKLVREFASEYSAVKEARGILDFDDLQERAARLFEANPRIAEWYRKQFRMIMVDEFQDTNDLQMRVLGHLRNDNFCMVGDERQSIYGFRYADVGIFNRVREQIGNQSQLADNFRSHPDVLAFVNAAFSRHELFGASFMKLRAGRAAGESYPGIGDGPRIRCLLVDTAECKMDAGRESEARGVAEQVARLVAAGTPPGDIAVLLRNASSASVYAAAIEARGLPVYVSAGQRFFETREVEEVLALLRVVALPFDDEALLQVLAGRLVGASDDALLALRTVAGPRGRLYDALRSCAREATEPGAESTGRIPEDQAEALAHAYRAIEFLRKAQTGTGLGEFVYLACTAFDYDLTLFSAGPEGVRAWANIEKLARFAEAFESTESSDLGAFVESMRLRGRETAREGVAAVETGSNSIRLMTIHGSKGLEFPVVFVGDLGVQTTRAANTFLVGTREIGGVRRPVVGVRLPDGADKPKGTVEHVRLAEELKASEIEEQKRCLYVACTRAREVLVMSGARDLQKEPDGSHLIDWVRLALGDPSESGAVEVGGVRVEVEVIAPPAEGEGGELVEAEGEVAETAGAVGGCTPARGVEKAAGAHARAPHAPIELALPRTTATECGRRPRTVSYTQLRQFEQCPYSYYVRSVLGLRELPGSSGGEAARFGSAVHAVLQAAGASSPVEPALGAAMRRFGLAETESERLATAVEAFLGSPVAARAFAGQRIEREQPLRVSLGATDLVGSLDLISWDEDVALVVDYKTGKAPEKDSERLPGYRLQASCYALAALLAGANEVDVVFVFVEHEAQTLAFRFGRGDEVGIAADIAGRITAMSQGEYPHKKAFSADVCQGCFALGGLCPVDDPRPRAHS